MNKQPHSINGFILLDKPSSISSNQVLNIAKRKLSLKKMGHSGTLDPFATGLLFVALGEATKFLPYIEHDPKVYQAKLKLGRATDTLDSTGQVTSEACVPEINQEMVQKMVQERFMGRIDQVPPMYSAKKHKGQRMYDLARQGLEVERKSVSINIYSYNILSIQLPYIEFEVSCSTGTYVRTLGSDLALALGTQGHLVALRRIAAGQAHLDKSINPDKTEDLTPYILPIERFLKHYAAYQANDDELRELSFGRPIKVGEGVSLSTDDVCLFYQDRFIGMGKKHQDQIIVKRLLSEIAKN